MHQLTVSILAFLFLTLAAGSALTATVIDSDEDGIPDSSDNCTLAANPEQTDTDNDGFGNRCDADFNNDNTVDDVDYSLFEANIASTHPLFDLNSNGVVTIEDYFIFSLLYGSTPGPTVP